MKKFFAILLTVTMMATMTMTAFAATINGDEGSVEVTYGVDEKYIVNIPANTSLTENGVPMEVSAKDVVIPYGNKLTVSVSSTNYSDSKWYLVDTVNAENKLEYSIKNGDNAVASGDAILTVAAGTTEEQKVTLTAKLEDTATISGTYKDTITFNVSVVAASKTVTELKAEKDVYNFYIDVIDDPNLVDIYGSETLEDVKFVITYSDGTSQTISYEEADAAGLTVTPNGEAFDATKEDETDYVYTVSFGGKTCQFTMRAKAYDGPME